MVVPPPMRTTSRTRETMRGSSRAASAIFVKGPIATIVTVPAGSRMRMSTMRRAAESSEGARVASGSVVPSRPDSPWISGAGTTSPKTRGRADPAATGQSRPQSSAMRRAFVVTFSIVWFPATVVTARTSTSG